MEQVDDDFIARYQASYGTHQLVLPTQAEQTAPQPALPIDDSVEQVSVYILYMLYVAASMLSFPRNLVFDPADVEYMCVCVCIYLGRRNFTKTPSFSKFSSHFKGTSRAMIRDYL